MLYYIWFGKPGPSLKNRDPVRKTGTQFEKPFKDFFLSHYKNILKTSIAQPAYLLINFGYIFAPPLTHVRLQNLYLAKRVNLKCLPLPPLEKK